MKKLLLMCLVAVFLSCNSSTDTDENLQQDSVDIIEPNVIHNDVPMRAVDTSQNLMADTINPRDTMQPR